MLVVVVCADIVPQILDQRFGNKRMLPPEYQNSFYKKPPFYKRVLIEIQYRGGRWLLLKIVWAIAVFTAPVVCYSILTQ